MEIQQDRQDQLQNKQQENDSHELVKLRTNTSVNDQDDLAAEELHVEQTEQSRHNAPREATPRLGAPREATPGLVAPREATPGLGVMKVKYKFSRKQKTIHKTYTDYCIKSNGICPTPDNMAWVNGDKQLHLIDQTGAQQRTLQPDVDICVITTHPITGDLYCCSYEDDIVRSVDTTTGKTSVLFTTDTMLLSIACTRDDHMVVGMFGRVRTYTLTGHLLHEYTLDSELFPNLSVCGTTNNVAVALQHDGVILLNDSLREIVHYKAQVQTCMPIMKCQRIRQETCFVSVASLDKYMLAGDSLNGNISVINTSTGRYKCTIHTKEMMSGVLAVGIQQDGGLWVGCCDEDTKKYSILCVG